MKYQEITKNEFSDKIGSVKIGAQNVQLCDHIQVVNGRYHVSALFTDEKETKALNDMGAQRKCTTEHKLRISTKRCFKTPSPSIKTA